MVRSIIPIPSDGHCILPQLAVSFEVQIRKHLRNLHTRNNWPVSEDRISNRSSAIAIYRIITQGEIGVDYLQHMCAQLQVNRSVHNRCKQYNGRCVALTEVQLECRQAV